MMGFVHFAIGMTGGILIAAWLDLAPRQRFPFVFFSGAWAMFPDVQLAVELFGLSPLIAVFGWLHDSSVANVFWFHHLLDVNEAGDIVLTRYYLFVAMAVLMAGVVSYTVFNDWRQST